VTATLDPFELAARAFELPTRRWPTPGHLARTITPKTVQTPALDLIDAALVELLDTPDGRLIITMPPQEGKSTRAAKDFPIWALTQNPDLRIVTASYSQSLANRNGRAIRTAIATTPDLNLRIAPDNGSVSEWQLAGHEGGVLSVGIGAGVTGRPADMLVIDDPIKDRKEADSEVFRQSRWDWWTDAASTRLAPGAPVVVILTRWHEDDLAGRLLAAEDGHLWKVLNIPALADHDPAKGESDALGREPGEFMVSARGRSTRQWEAKKVSVGSRTWASLYQGRPSAAEGNILKREWWQRYDHHLHLVRDDGSCIVSDYDDLIASWDLAFKDTKGSDWVVGQVWMRRGAHAYLLDQVRRRMDFPATLQAFEALSAKWPQAVLKIVEDKANGPAVIASLRTKIVGIVPEEPQGGKVARASAVSPLIEAGNVWIPTSKLAPWSDALIEEAAGFPNAAHDDQVDALSQGLNRLILQPLLETGDGETHDYDDLDDEVGDYVIDPLSA
jgi:predicted phage terminase large subunit-like protein